MPGRYISDTVQHCITVTKRIRVPRFMPWRFFPVTSYPPVFGTLSTHVFRYGDPVVPGVHELSKATLMAEEKPYVYHLLPASQHIGGAVLKAAAGPDSTAEYTIDLGGEPAPVYSYLHLHPDTASAIQSLNVTVHHSPGVLVEARIRQYNASGVEDFSVPLDWQPLPEGQPYALDFATDVTAIMAGGATMLEYRTSPVGGGTFAAASEVTYTSTIVTVSLSELRDVLVTICDEKDNYRFGFNGQEKVNEVNGIGNHNTALFWEYDTRLGWRWNIDPVVNPSISSYATFEGNPVWKSDPLGNTVKGNKEAGEEMTKALSANLGEKNPFSYDEKNEELRYDDKFDISGYDKDQMELVHRYSKLVKDDLVTKVHMVNRNSKVDLMKSDDNPEGTLEGANANGHTVTTIDGNDKIVEMNVFIARDPVKIVSRNRTEFDGFQTRLTDLQPYDKSYVGIVTHHEIAGHAFLHLTQPTMTRENHDLNVEDFQRVIQRFYKVGNFYPYKNSNVPSHVH